MSKWSLDEDEDYFRIFDSKKEIAGYFDPDYGQAHSQVESEEIERIIHDRIPIPGGYLMLPLAKFEIFDTDYESDIYSLEKRIESVSARIAIWKKFIDGQQNHMIRISHTDHDMLSITFPVKFEKPIPVDKKLILQYIEPMLDKLSSDGLL